MQYWGYTYILKNYSYAPCNIWNKLIILKYVCCYLKLKFIWVSLSPFPFFSFLFPLFLYFVFFHVATLPGWQPHFKCYKITFTPLMCRRALEARDFFVKRCDIRKEFSAKITFGKSWVK